MTVAELIEKLKTLPQETARLQSLGVQFKEEWEK